MNTATKFALASLVAIAVVVGVFSLLGVKEAEEARAFPNTYSDDIFSIQYPDGYVVDTAYSYQTLGPGKEIPGVKFTVPPQQNTNLSNDSYLSVESLESEICSADLFAGDIAPQLITEGEVTYSVVAFADAGAGNRYEEKIYAIPDSNPCVAVRYFIHYSAIENFPPGEVAEFNKHDLLYAFDAIRATLRLAP